MLNDSQSNYENLNQTQPLRKLSVGKVKKPVQNNGRLITGGKLVITDISGKAGIIGGEKALYEDNDTHQNFADHPVAKYSQVDHIKFEHSNGFYIMPG